jgi:hypothetical protein
VEVKRRGECVKRRGDTCRRSLRASVKRRSAAAEFKEKASRSRPAVSPPTHLRRKCTQHARMTGGQ